VETAPRVVVRTEYVTAPIPANLTDCEAPTPTDIKTMGDVKQYLVALHQAGVSCQIDAEAVRDVVNVE
jgi:hypothetical protein